MKTYRVIVSETYDSEYFIDAEDEQDARENWYEGQMVNQECWTAHVEEVELIEN